MTKLKVFNSKTGENREMGEIQFKNWGEKNGWELVPETETQNEQEEPEVKPYWVRDSMAPSIVAKNEAGSTENGGVWEMLYRDEVEAMGIDPDTTQNANNIRPEPKEEIVPKSEEETNQSNDDGDGDGGDEIQETEEVEETNGDIDGSKSTQEETEESNSSDVDESQKTSESSKDFGIGEAVAKIKEMAEKKEFDKIKQFSNGDERSTIEKAVKKFVPTKND